MQRSDTQLRSPSSTPRIVASVALGISFLVSYLMDSTLVQLRTNASTSFDFLPVVVFSALAPFIVVSGILFLGWLVLVRLPPRRFNALVFLLVGIVVLGLYISFFAGSPPWLRETILGRLRSTLMDFGFLSSTYHVAAGAVVVGLAGLWRSRSLPDHRT